MQGLWKNKVSGWKKDSKRKKQKFKHFMRDKKDFVIKRIFKNDLKELEVVLFEKVFYEKRVDFKLKNTKYFYKGNLLSRQIYFPDKYYYYGSYSENVSTPRSIIKQHLKNANYDFVPIKKSIIIYG